MFHIFLLSDVMPREFTCISLIGATLFFMAIGLIIYMTLCRLRHDNLGKSNCCKMLLNMWQLLMRIFWDGLL